MSGSNARSSWGQALVVLVIGCGLVAAATFAVYDRTAPRYVARGSILMVAPDARPADGGPVNSLLLLSDLELTRGVVLESLNAQAVADRVRQAAPSATYEVVPDPMSAAPILVVNTDAASPEEAAAALTAVTSSVQPRLNRLQNQLKVARRDRVKAQRLTFEADGAVDRTNQIRASVLVGGAGVGAVLLLVVLLESRRRRAADE